MQAGRPEWPEAVLDRSRAHPGASPAGGCIPSTWRREPVRCILGVFGRPPRPVAVRPTRASACAHRAWPVASQPRRSTSHLLGQPSLLASPAATCSGDLVPPAFPPVVSFSFFLFSWPDSCSVSFRRLSYRLLHAGCSPRLSPSTLRCPFASLPDPTPSPAGHLVNTSTRSTEHRSEMCNSCGRSLPFAAHRARAGCLRLHLPPRACLGLCCPGLVHCAASALHRQLTDPNANLCDVRRQGVP